MAISERTGRAMESGGWIRRMFEVGAELTRQHGADNVYDLSLGNPIMEPPQELLSSLQMLVNSNRHGLHRYMPNAGYPSVRTAVAEAVSADTALPFTADEIVMTCGAAGALNVIFETTLNPGEEVVIFAPFFGEFTFYIENHRGIPVIAPTTEEFLPDLDAVDALITSRTRAVLINSPNNPTGALYPEAIIRQLGELIQRKERQLGTEIFLLSDEPYRRIIFDGHRYPHIFDHHSRGIAVHSHSKDLAVPGERVGYTAVHPHYEDKAQLIDGLIFWNRSLGFVNSPAIMQHIITRLQNVTVDVSEYQRKRDYLYGELTGMGYEMVKPAGAFYMFPKSPLDDDIEFVAELQKERVLTVPGTGFGAPGYFRISYCVEDRVLEGAMAGFSRSLDRTRG